MPDGEFALLAEDVEVGVGERGRELRVDNRRQRNLGAVGVPQGKNRVLGLVAVVDLPVCSAVASVDIAVEGGEDHSVVKRRVEDFLLTRIHGLDLDAPEGLVPLGVCLLGRPVEVPVGKLFAKVVPCTLATYGGEGNLYEDLLVRGCVEKKHIGRTVILKLLDSLPCDGLAELCREVPCVVLGPSAGAAEALDMGAVHDGEPAVEAAVPADAGGEVHEDGGLVGRESIFVEADALGSGKAHLHSVVRKLQRVEAGPDALQGVVEVGVDVPDLLLLLDNPALGANGLGGVVGQKQHIAQIADSGAGEMGVAEAYRECVRYMVAGAPVPFVLDLLGAELDHSARHAGANEDMAVAAASDHRVDFVRKGNVLGAAGEGEKRECRKD